MKKLTVLLILLIIFIVSIFIGRLGYNKLINKPEVIEKQNVEKNIEEKTNIIQREEISSMGLFEKNGVENYENNLVANDMIWDSDTRLYYKIISNKEDYNKYYERIYLFNNNDIDFEKNNIIIVVNENERESFETDLIIYDVNTEETTTNIVLKQRENPRAYCDNNIFCAIVSKSLIKDAIDVKIQH